MSVFIPLDPETKHPAVRGWAKPNYQGVDRCDYCALRTDGIAVVDCDTMEAAEAWVQEFEHVETPYVVRTGRGMHFYYRQFAGQGSRPLVPGQIDLKTGSGSYVLPAGALHPSGRRYEQVAVAWQAGPLTYTPASSYLVIEDLPELPFEIVNKLRPARQAVAFTDPAAGWDVVPEGARNMTLTALGGCLRRQGAGPSVIGATLAAFNHNRCSPPLDDAEVVQIVMSVVRYKSDPFETDGDIEVTA